MAKTQTRKAEVLPAESPDLALVQTDGQAVGAFLANIVPFFRKAGELERQAKDMLLAAQRITAPATSDEDAQIQVFVRSTTASRKQVEEHWSICQVFSGLHRKLTAGRGRATQPLEEAASVAQRLHNRYAEEQQRKARAEEDRQRREAEERARVAREAELADLERQALAAEADRDDLSEREQDFVQRMVAFPTAGGERCAAGAGYKDGFKAASRLLSTPKILEAIKARQQAIAIREQAAAVKEQPVEVEVERVRPDVQKVGSDRTTWAGEVVDLERFRAAALDPVERTKYGIPADVLTVDGPKLNEYARSLHEQMDRWPGVRAKRTTRTV